MEPMRHSTYYEDVYKRPKRDDDDDDPVEVGDTFDLCEDSSEDETEDVSSKHAKKNLKYPTSYGTIKEPTRKTAPDLATYSYTRADSTKTSRIQK
jgi:hypothetical protein